MIEIKKDYDRIGKNILGTVRTYLKMNPSLSSLVVGISGGIDSALTCALAHEALKEVDDVRLIGRSIPIETNTDHEILRARNIGRSFCDAFQVKDLTRAYQDLYSAYVAETARKQDNTKDEKIRRGNLKARVRMAYLFDIAHFEQGMVLSTDNYTELLLGFWTLHGDVGNYGLIQYLWKTEVYGLARYLADKYRTDNMTEKADALEECIHAVPTDGLGITTSDFDQIGVADYEAADRILIDYLKGDRSHADHPVIQRHLGSAHKRKDPQFISRETLFQD